MLTSCKLQITPNETHGVHLLSRATMPSSSSSSSSPPSKHKRSEYIVETETTEVQEETEEECIPFFVDLTKLPSSQLDHLRDCGLLSRDPDHPYDLCLMYNKHEDFLVKAYERLRPSFVSLDASRPWMIYWTLHSLDLMDRLPSQDTLDRILSTLQHCWQSTQVTFDTNVIQNDPILKSFVVNSNNNDALDTNTTTTTTTTTTITIPAGGFGGGPGQLAHCATSYAAILALSIIASVSPMPNSVSDYLTQIRQPLYAWYLSLQQPDGGFRMHHDGEVDVRATYTMLAVTSLLNITTPQLTQHAASYIASCQTYEGGFGGEPFSEAHGGYAFCAVAALQLLNSLKDAVVDIENLRGWLARRQMSFEGGFAGRSNKLADGCYSFWQGGAMAILSARYSTTDDGPRTSSTTGCLYHPHQDCWLSILPSSQSAQLPPPPKLLLFDEKMLQRFILLCAQDPNGGLRDKPSKPRDFYHSCYNLSGLSVTQHYCSSKNENNDDDDAFGHAIFSRVAATHPLFNIRIDRATPILQQFYNLE